MGAASVTGIGQGAAADLKGPSNGRNYFNPAVAPHIVAAGAIVTGDHVGSVVLPNNLELGASDYMIMLNVVNGAGAAGRNVHVTAKTNDVDGKMISFNVYTEVASEALEWVIMRRGWCL